MNEQERAEEHLRTIRRLMERGTIYRAISAPTALVGGVLSLVASYVIWIRSAVANAPAPDATNLFIWLWLLVLLLTSATNNLIIVLGAKKRNEPVFSPSMKAAYTALAPALIVGGAWTLLLSGVGWYSGLCLLTGIVWAICYGLALLATSHFAPRSLTLLGWAFLMAGIAALLCVRLKPGVIDETSRPGILFLAATFGLFHLIYAACAWPRRGAAHEL